MVIVALLLGLAISNVDAQSCSKWTCEESSQTFEDDQCLFHDVTANAYYLKKCADSTQACQPTGADLLNWYCTTPYPGAILYPGEKCSDNDYCVIAPSTCTNGVCSGIAVGQNCTASSQCVPGSSCQGAEDAQVCTNLIAKDETGCAWSWDCEYNLACDIVSVTDVSQNFCRAIKSYKDGTALGSAASCFLSGQLLCSSGTCAPITTGGTTTFYCTVPLKSKNVVPITCTSLNANAACNSVTDSKTGYATTGMCACGQNADRKAYCGLNPGDKVFSDYFSRAVDWLGSSAIKNCNTMRRDLPGSATCATNYYSSSELNELLYFFFRALYYITIYDSEDCVVDTLYASYKKIEDDYKSDDINSAALLPATALLLAFA